MGNSIYNVYTDVNESWINNKLDSIQTKIDRLSRNISILNNSQNLNLISNQYEEEMRTLNNELNTIIFFSAFNNDILNNSNFLKKYNIDFQTVSLSKLDEIIREEKNKKMKSETFKENIETTLSRKNMVKILGMITIIIFLIMYFYV
jgi:hypothetical protein